ncbi:MAG: AAA family ATPase, partial [Gammaproteobacteria bacterium]
MIARKIISYENVDATDPLRHLTYIAIKHKDRIKENRASLNQAGKNRILFDYYKKYQSENNISESTFEFPEFVEAIENEEFKDSMLDNVAIIASGKSPVNEVNKVLEKYNFKYHLFLEDDKNASDGARLILKNKHNNDSIKPAQLSSGERLILSIMSWLYYQEGATDQIQQTISDNKIKVLLLDEPDKHLDPKLGKLLFDIINDVLVESHKVQVIMSTHRFESIAYAPKNSIYTVQRKEEKLEVLPVTRMDAIFKMTVNIRELAAYEKRVYTESVSDALFYEGVYHQLVKTFSKPIHETKSNWYPSRRYPLTFHAVSKEKSPGNDKGDGGCNKVVDRIKTDENAINNLQKQNKNGLSRWQRISRLVDDPALLHSFGIVDFDYGATQKLISSNNLETRMVFLQRYSLENFCLDPIIFCSVLSKNKISDYIKYIKLSPTASNDANEIKKELLDVSLAIKQKLEEKKYNNLQLLITRYFAILLSIVMEKLLLSPQSNKPETNQICHSIGYELTNPTPTFCNRKILFITEKNDKFILYYPAEFLEIRGHTLEEKIFGNDSRQHPSDEIALNVYDQGLAYIPSDLIHTFKELDDKIRANARASIKPKQLYKINELLLPRQLFFQPDTNRV